VTSPTISGSCLCGSIQFEIAPPIPVFRYCHCSRCRKASGSAHAANIFLPQAQLTWKAGEALIQRFDLPGAQRFSVWFCPRCGSRTPHKARDRDAYLVPAGLLDGDPAVRPQSSIFWASRAPWYVEPGAAPKFDEYS
jgi:hypothetical protein